MKKLVMAAMLLCGVQLAFGQICEDYETDSPNGSRAGSHSLDQCVPSFTGGGGGFGPELGQRLSAPDSAQSASHSFLALQSVRPDWMDTHQRDETIGLGFKAAPLKLPMQLPGLPFAEVRNIVPPAIHFPSQQQIQTPEKSHPTSDTGPSEVAHVRKNFSIPATTAVLVDALRSWA